MRKKMFDYKKYIKPLQKWLEELGTQEINKYGDEVLIGVSFEVYELISNLLGDYIYRMEHEDE